MFNFDLLYLYLQVKLKENIMYGVKLPNNFQPLVKSHAGPVYTVRFNNAGQYIMSGSQDRGVCLYNPHKNIMIKNYKNLHNYDVSTLAITKDNSKFVTAGGDKMVIITDVVEGKAINKYSAHNGRINSVALNEQNNVIITGSYDTTVKFWDNRASCYTPIDIIKGFKDSVSHVQANNFEITCGSMDGTVRFYDIRTGQFISDQVGQAVQSMALAQSGKAYAISTVDNFICLIDKATGNKVMEYRGHQVKNYSINCKFNQQDTHIFSGSSDGQLFIFDIMKSEAIKKIAVTSGSPLSALDVHPESGLVAGAHDGSIYYFKF